MEDITGTPGAVTSIALSDGDSSGNKSMPSSSSLESASDTTGDSNSIPMVCPLTEVSSESSIEEDIARSGCVLSSTYRSG